MSAGGRRRLPRGVAVGACRFPCQHPHSRPRRQIPRDFRPHPQATHAAIRVRKLQPLHSQTWSPYGQSSAFVCRQPSSGRFQAPRARPVPETCWIPGFAVRCWICLRSSGNLGALMRVNYCMLPKHQHPARFKAKTGRLPCVCSAAFAAKSTSTDFAERHLL